MRSGESHCAETLGPERMHLAVELGVSYFGFPALDEVPIMGTGRRLCVKSAHVGIQQMPDPLIALEQEGRWINGQVVDRYPCTSKDARDATA